MEFATIRGFTVARNLCGMEEAMANTELLARLDAAIAERNLLKHPFYQDWQAGKLSREALQLYAAQYYRHVEAFPKHLRLLASPTQGPLQGLIRQNVAEEENPEGPHPKLWRECEGGGGGGGGGSSSVAAPRRRSG